MYWLLFGACDCVERPAVLLRPRVNWLLADPRLLAAVVEDRPLLRLAADADVDADADIGTT